MLRERLTELWVPETLHMSCDVLMAVEEAADVDEAG